MRSACLSSTIPLPRFACIGTTGTPSSSDSSLRVEPQAGPLRHVDHVQRDHHRQAELDDLQHQVEVALERRGVDHADHQVGRASPVDLAAQHVGARSARPARPALERVAARQVDDPQLAAVRGEGRRRCAARR